MGFWSSVWNGVKSVGNAVFGSGNGGAVVSGISGIVSNSQQMKYQKDLMALQNKYNTAAGKTSYEYSKKLQEYQNNYTSKMASTAHQIEVNDLRKAGLNPILSATGGSGAVVPGAGNASIGVSGSSGGTAPDVDYLASALAYKESRSVRRQREFQNDLTNAQTGTELERHNTQEAETDLFYKQIEDLENQIKNRNLTTSANVKRLETMNKTDLMNALTNQIVGSASAYYNTHRALGFSNSFSQSDSDSKSLGLPGVRSSRGYSSSSHQSRTW